MHGYEDVCGCFIHPQRAPHLEHTAATTTDQIYDKTPPQIVEILSQFLIFRNLRGKFTHLISSFVPRLSGGRRKRTQKWGCLSSCSCFAQSVYRIFYSLVPLLNILNIRLQ